MDSDDDVRDMLLRGGYDVTSDHDVRNYADDMAFVRDRKQVRDRLRFNRARFVIWFFGSIGVAIVGALVSLGMQWLNISRH